MQTIIKKVDFENPHMNIDVIDEGASILKNGGLVAFPTETVYGLGANALNAEAVSNIYKAKGRPSDNPLIVHISDIEDLNGIVKEITLAAEKLIQAFWPGPLTIVLKKSDNIPFETSGGLDTVAVRMPENKIARLLIEHSGVPVAAPSANLSGRPSPTMASHVIMDLNGKIEMIIDGGDSVLGIESTVVDVSGDTPVILRPGSVSAQDIKNICGCVAIDPAVMSVPAEDYNPKSPGQKYRHYSPEAKLTIFSGDRQSIINKINELIEKDPCKNIGIMCTDANKSCYKKGYIISLGDGGDPAKIASNLFKTLREFDKLNVSKIYAEAFPETEQWLAVMNRLKKAAAYDIMFL